MRVLVTGGSSGLGAALVARFAERGDSVLSCDVTTPAAELSGADVARATSAPDNSVVRRRLDVTSEDDWAATRAWVEQEWGGLDLLVNNAGVAGGGRVELCSLEEWQWIFDVNLFGMVRGTRAFVSLLKAQGSGRIVNTASLAGLVHPPGMGSYNAVKAAVVAFSETLSHELAPFGVGCTVVCPSYFKTNLMDSLRGQDVDLAAQLCAAGRVVPDQRRRHRGGGARRPRPRPRRGRPGRARAGGVRPQARRPRGLRRPDARNRGAGRPTHRSADGSADRHQQRGAGMSDPTTAVRDEDAFDVEAVAAWLREHGDDVPAGTPEVQQFPGGASNLTYLLRYPSRDLILRRPPGGQKARSAHDMGREHRIQSALAPVFPYVPGMVAFCDDPEVIGSDFYVMEKVEGTIPRSELPDGVSLDEQAAGQLCRDFLDVLVELHQVDPTAAGLDDLGRGAGYVARQVGGWSDRFRKARTDNVGDYETVMGWLEEHQPADIATTVIHNDFRLDNVVLATEGPVKVVGVLDWEMATLGDPLMDLGGAMAYWIQADDDADFLALRRQPSHLPGMLTRAEMVAHYTERMGYAVTPEQWRFYEVFGLFRLGAIAQQIYYRYHHGQTRNEAYAHFLPMVQLLEKRCERLIAP